MERLYEKVFAELERKRTEKNSKFFHIEEVLLLVSQQYYDLAEECEEEIEEYAEQIWERYRQHLLTIDPKADVMEDGLVIGLTGWDEDDFDDEEEDDEEEDDEEEIVTRADSIERHIKGLLDGEGDGYYDEYTTIVLSEDKESVIVTDDFEHKTKTFKISDYKELVFLARDIDDFVSY